MGTGYRGVVYINNEMKKYVNMSQCDWSCVVCGAPEGWCVP